jgi:hypothetical protein
VAQPKQVTKEQEAIELSARAAQLADVNGSGIMEMGVICLRFKQEPELVELAGCRTYRDWLTKYFGQKAKTAMRCRSIVEKLTNTQLLTRDQLVELGQVKAYELSRLPESQLRDGDWIKKAFEMDGLNFKQAVKNFLANRPDHMEEMHFVNIPLTESQLNIFNDCMKASKHLLEEMGEVVDAKGVVFEYILSVFMLSDEYREYTEVNDDIR